MKSDQKLVMTPDTTQNTITNTTTGMTLDMKKVNFHIINPSNQGWYQITNDRKDHPLDLIWLRIAILTKS